MFQSPRRLKEDIAALLEAIRVTASGRYACVMDPSAILFETPEPEGREIATLRRLLDLNMKSLFELPAAMAGEDSGPAADPFEGWEHDELLLVFLNGRVAIVVACPDAEGSREVILTALTALVDRLLRYNESYRLNAKGRGLFFGRPKLDFVTIAHAPLI
jgi:hypothetical protein